MPTLLGHLEGGNLTEKPVLELELLYDWQFTASLSWKQAPWDS
jgi:hypothetical protein